MQSPIKIVLSVPLLDYESLVGMQSEFDGQKTRDVVVDLSEVEKMTTAAVAQLIMLKRAFADAGRDFAITGLQEQPEALRNLLKLTCLLGS